MQERVFLSMPDVGELEEQNIMSALRPGWIAPLGPEVDAFEDEVAERCDREYAVALSSGTAALHLGLLAMGVGPGDTVVTSSMTFAATANTITHTGAEPYFVDCDETGNMDPGLLAEALAKLTAEGKHIAAIIPVDLLGKMADYPAIIELANQYGIPVFSDAAESFGASLKIEKGVMSAASFGEAAVLSFNGNKVRSTSGGGVFLTDNKDLADKVRHLAMQARQPVVHYEHTDIVYNYRMSNTLAALGRAQFLRLDEMITKRKGIRAGHRALFRDLPGATILQAWENEVAVDLPADEQYDNCWLKSIVVDPGVAVWSLKDLSDALNALNIENSPLWKPMQWQPVSLETPAKSNRASEVLFASRLKLPSGSELAAGPDAVFTALGVWLRGAPGE